MVSWFIGPFSIMVCLLASQTSSKERDVLGHFFTMPFGLTEPLFVPEYWNPPSLFNLAATTGFDLESLIFCFAIGGIGSVLYEMLVNRKHTKMTKHERHTHLHKHHLLALLSPILFFLIFEMITTWNSIYTASIAMFGGGIAALFCRPDLKKKIWIGAFLFLMLYFFFFLFWIAAYPSLVQRFWNLSALSGILIVGIPFEELLFAFTFGMIWSSVYEHLLWLKVEK